MEIFFKLPEWAQFFLVVCAIFAGTIIGVIFLYRYLKLDEIFPEIQQSKENTSRIAELEKNLEKKIKEQAIIEIENSKVVDGLKKQLESETSSRWAIEIERDKLQKTFTSTVSNLNDRMDELENTLKEQEVAISSLQTQLEEKNTTLQKLSEEKEQLIKDKKSLEDTQTRIEAEKRGILAMARELRLKIDVDTKDIMNEGEIDEKHT